MKSKVLDLSEQELDELGISKCNGGYYKFFCQSPYLAQVLNRLLAYPHPKETNFIQEGSEAIFKFDGSKLKTVLAVIKNVT